jgi:hypothetical protein
MMISFKLQRSATAGSFATSSKTLWGKFTNSLLLVLFLLSWIVAAPAAVPDLVWAKNSGNASISMTAADGAGNVYIAGTFSGSTVTLGDKTLSRIGVADAIVAKFDPTDAVLWAKNFGGSGTSAGASNIVLDSSGRIYVRGVFTYGNLTAPPLTIIGIQDVFAMKLDESGNTIWAKNFGGPGTTVDPGGLAVAGGGNVYLSGAFGANLTTPPDSKSRRFRRIPAQTRFIRQYDLDEKFCQQGIKKRWLCPIQTAERGGGPGAAMFIWSENSVLKRSTRRPR